MEATGGWVYDARLDRYDVAIRAIVKLCQGKVRGSKQYLDQLGLTQEHAREVQEALLEIDTLKSEDGIFALLGKCPYLLWAAVELLGMYQQKYQLTRLFFYAGRGARR